MYDSKEDRKEFRRWGRTATWVVAFAFVVLTIIGGVLHASGKLFNTAVEREVFEQSYQRSAAETQRFNTLTAELEGAEARLSAGNLNDVQRADLEAHAAALRIQIRQMGGVQ